MAFAFLKQMPMTIDLERGQGTEKPPSTYLPIDVGKGRVYLIKEVKPADQSAALVHSWNVVLRPVSRESREIVLRNGSGSTVQWNTGRHVAREDLLTGINSGDAELLKLRKERDEHFERYGSNPGPLPKARREELDTLIERARKLLDNADLIKQKTSWEDGNGRLPTILAGQSDLIISVFTTAEITPVMVTYLRQRWQSVGNDWHKVFNHLAPDHLRDSDGIPTPVPISDADAATLLRFWEEKATYAKNGRARRTSAQEHELLGRWTVIKSFNAAPRGSTVPVAVPKSLASRAKQPSVYKKKAVSPQEAALAAELKTLMSGFKEAMALMAAKDEMRPSSADSALKRTPTKPSSLWTAWSSYWARNTSPFVMTNQAVFDRLVDEHTPGPQLARMRKEAFTSLCATFHDLEDLYYVPVNGESTAPRPSWVDDYLDNDNVTVIKGWPMMAFCGDFMGAFALMIIAEADPRLIWVESQSFANEAKSISQAWEESDLAFPADGDLAREFSQSGDAPVEPLSALDELSYLDEADHAVATTLYKLVTKIQGVPSLSKTDLGAVLTATETIRTIKASGAPTETVAAPSEREVGITVPPAVAERLVSGTTFTVSVGLTGDFVYDEIAAVVSQPAVPAQSTSGKAVSLHPPLPKEEKKKENLPPTPKKKEKVTAATVVAHPLPLKPSTTLKPLTGKEAYEVLQAAHTNKEYGLVIWAPKGLRPFEPEVDFRRSTACTCSEAKCSHVVLGKEGPVLINKDEAWLLNSGQPWQGLKKALKSSAAVKGKGKEEEEVIAPLQPAVPPPTCSEEQIERLKKALNVLPMSEADPSWDASKKRAHYKARSVPKWAIRSVLVDPENLGKIERKEITRETFLALVNPNPKPTKLNVGVEWAKVKSSHPGVRLAAKPRTPEEKSLRKAYDQLRKAAGADHKSLPRITTGKRSGSSTPRSRSSSPAPSGSDTGVLSSLKTMVEMAKAFGEMGRAMRGEK